jgi:hypothetical protein
MPPDTTPTIEELKAAHDDAFWKLLERGNNALPEEIDEEHQLRILLEEAKHEQAIINENENGK